MLTEQEKLDLALTIAGEIHPGLTRYGTEEAREEIANILASIENRYDLADGGRYATRSDVVKEPAQYSTWNTEGARATARENYQDYQEHIDSTIEDFYNGKLQATAPHTTNYWSPTGMRYITGGARSEPKWGPSITNRTTSGPQVFGTHRALVDDLQLLDLNSRVAAIPVPTGRGVTRQEFAIAELANNTEPPWSSQYAPGSTGLLGADPVAQVSPLDYFGPPAPRSDYPVGPTDPEPWASSFAPAPQYAPSIAQPAPGPSEAALAAAYESIADSMVQAGVGGLDGQRVAGQSAEDKAPGLGSVEAGMPPAPHAYDPGTLHRVPLPKARPGGYRPMPAPVPRRRPVAPGGVVPVPTARPKTKTRLTPSTIPVPTPAPQRDAGLVPTRGAIAPLGPYVSGPKKQIFDFVLGKLLKPRRPAN